MAGRRFAGGAVLSGPRVAVYQVQVVVGEQVRDLNKYCSSLLLVVLSLSYFVLFLVIVCYLLIVMLMLFCFWDLKIVQQGLHHRLVVEVCLEEVQRVVVLDAASVSPQRGQDRERESLENKNEKKRRASERASERARERERREGERERDELSCCCRM